MAEDTGVRFDFGGRVAVITGAASGIGLQCARDFAAAGARVAVNDLDPAKVQAVAAEIGAMPLPGDVTDEAVVKALVARVAGEWGRIDYLVNCAGIADEMKPTLDQDIDRWQRVLDVSLRGSYLMARECGRAMTAARSGVIVNLSSIAGLVGLPGRNAYSAAKAGLAMMTRGLAAEWGGHGIRVNAIAPGYIDTPMVEGLLSRGRIGTEGILRRTPLGRFGQPAEISAAIQFLCSPAASYVTGVTLAVDGGYSAFGGNALPEAGQLQ
ncbi:SDR family NAD(P)-dependent oxidoreductase [Ruixingdingia sedimenti]|uniref:SDR family oxidoreductase n=1 Tax=Ruixingdingia sedimenti TaxID=3073604 RepID=A0ABU1F7D3_9RHOB|nr:SDR family oxidoreductase [Xinfangfangia sp. LG-4]MDR5652782.1 SDR family oxidoreductase [Xinfangfangia sp. LG-4]